MLGWSWQAVMKMDPAELVRGVREAEDLDRERQRWPRFKISDDATAVFWEARGGVSPDASPAPDPLPVVAAVITSDRGVLIGRRVDGKPPWGFISGAIGPIESPSEAAVRETQEETGLAIQAGDVIGQRVHPNTGRSMTYIACVPVSGTDAAVLDAIELAEVRWAALDEASQLMPDMYPPVRAYLASMLAAPARKRP
jgi:8-oxo-dGTP diphosphatase